MGYKKTSHPLYIIKLHRKDEKLLAVPPSLPFYRPLSDSDDISCPLVTEEAEFPLLQKLPVYIAQTI